MNNDVACVLGPLDPFFQDWIGWDLEHTQLLVDVRDDITKRIKSRGIGIALIDLPELGKVFDKALSSSFFDWDLYPKTLGSLNKGSPLCRLISIFLDEIDLVTLAPNPDPNRIFFMRTLLYFYKKYRKDCSDETIHQALRSFIKTDMDLPSPVLNWDSDWLDIGLSFRADVSSRICGQTSLHTTGKLLGIVENVSSRIISRFGEVCITDLVPRNGPGAVAEGTRFRDKYQFDTWSEKLEGCFPYGLFANPGLMGSGMNHEPPARVLAVPKTLKSPRIITAEPHSNQYCQQAMLIWMRKHLPSPLLKSIDFSSQEKSRDLVLQASKNGLLASIDLSEASDRLSLRTIEFLFGANESVLRFLHSCRTRWASIENATYFKLKKYAGMGNATTFPVQSIAYAMLCIATVIYVRGWDVSSRTIAAASRSVQVFGDDLIIPSDCVRTLEYLMTDLGLKVNESKTHSEGYFRESCGMDAYGGFDVTPFYLREGRISRLEELPSWVEVSNNAYRKGLWYLADWMRRMIPNKDQRLIPVSSKECFSLRLHSFQDVVAFGVRDRYDKRIHARVYRILVVSTSEKRVERHNEQSLLQYFVEAPSPDQSWSSGWVRRAGTKLSARWASAYG